MSDTHTNTLGDQTILATWQALVVPQHERSRQWYIVGSVIVMICAVYGILTGSWPLAIVALLCGAMYYLMRDHVPPMKTIVITDGGVMLNETFTRWEDLLGFWLLPTPDYTELHFVPKTKRKGDILIQTGTQPLADLRVLIGSHIPELTEKHEGLLDALIRIAKL